MSIFLPRLVIAAPRLLMLAAAGALASPGALTAGDVLPRGGTVMGGSAQIGAPAGNSLTITQNSSNAVINWQTFNIGAGNAVTFSQRPTDQLLNRVTSDTPSSIAGTLSAGGSVYLINPNGITITPSGKVTAGGGFVASTLDISAEDFMAGHRTFTGSGASAGVSNEGTITVGDGGYVALLGGTVSTSGMISVPFGKVGLGSGERITLDPNGDGFMQVAVPTGAASKTLIDVAGKIRAKGGRIELKAATAREVIRDAVNVPGSLEARSVSGRSSAKCAPTSSSRV